jgi:phosphate-selective porin OprO/OprP
MNWTAAAFVAIVVSPLSVAAQGHQAAPASPSNTLSKAESGPQHLKKQVRITVETNLPPAAAATNQVAPKQKSFQWKSSWDGWDGLHTEVSQKTSLNDPFETWRFTAEGTNGPPLLHLEELKMSGKIGAKFAVDAAGYATSKEFQDIEGGAELRRARVYAKGDCLLILPVSYQLELGYVPSQFYIEESYLAFKDIPYIGQIKIGQYQAPMGLDAITSSRDVTFMEPAAPIQALAPGVNAGIQIGRPVFNERATWALGIFTDGVGQDFGDASKDYGRAIIRLTGLPIYRPDPDQPGSVQLLHVGLSANVLYSGNSTVRYQSRPESHLAPHVLDTGDIAAQRAVAFGTEAAWVNGPFCVQGEMLSSYVEQGDTTLDFHGFYASASWFLTGESRPYDRTEGQFARVIPKQNFNWGHGGWGAWEVAGRLSYTDLNSGDIDGGRIMMVMAGVNWYLHSHVKWRFDYGFGQVSGRSPEGNLNIFQTRIEVDF